MKEEKWWIRHQNIWVPIFCAFLSAGFSALTTWYFTSQAYKEDLRKLESENVALKTNPKTEEEIELEIKHIKENLIADKEKIKNRFIEKRKEAINKASVDGTLRSPLFKRREIKIEQEEKDALLEAERQATHKIEVLEEQKRKIKK